MQNSFCYSVKVKDKTFPPQCLMDVISRLAKEASSIIIGRDWVVTVCGGDRARLAKLNVWLTRTDELFGIVAPLAISFLRQVGVTF